MKEYQVSVPVMGVAHLTVMAESEEDALNEAIDIASPADVDEWQTFRAVIEGNVFYGSLNRARIDDVYDPDEA